MSQEAQEAVRAGRSSWPHQGSPGRLPGVGGDDHGGGHVSKQLKDKKEHLSPGRLPGGGGDGGGGEYKLSD